MYLCETIPSQSLPTCISRSEARRNVSPQKTKHFKPKPKFVQPEWYQMCRPNPSPTRLPKNHPSYDEEGRRNLDNMIYILTIQVEGAEIKRKQEYEKNIRVTKKNNMDYVTPQQAAAKNSNTPETNTGIGNNDNYVQHEIWIERENELRWDLCSALYRQSMYLRNHKKNVDVRL